MIKIDMQMPTICEVCPFYSGYKGGTCIASGDYDLNFLFTCPSCEKHHNCPLQEVEDDV